MLVFFILPALFLNPTFSLTSLPDSCFVECYATLGYYCASKELNIRGTICPVGTYGDRSGLTAAVCSGSCLSPRGYFCSAGATSINGFACPSGRYNPDVSSSSNVSCLPCSYGSYSVFGGSSSCSSYKPVDFLSSFSWNYLSAPRSGLLGLSVGLSAYFVGGFSNTVDIFDSITSKWSVSHISVSRLGLSGTSVGSKLVVAGGFLDILGTVASSIADVYDSVSDRWSFYSTALSVSRGYFASCSLMSSLVLFGGGTSSLRLPFVRYSTIDLYNSSDNTFSSGIYELSVARSHLSSCSYDRVSVFAGGRDNLNGRSDIVDVFSFGQWTTSVLSVGRSDLVCTRMGSVLFFVGGYVATSVESSAIDLYDTMVSRWNTMQLPERLSRLSVLSIGSKLICAGGISFGIVSSAIYIFDFSTDRWTKSLRDLSVPVCDFAGVSIGDLALFAGGNSGSSFTSQVTYISFCPIGIGFSIMLFSIC